MKWVFQKKTIKKVYAFLNPINITLSIIYLTEENWIYNHQFYEYHNKNKDKCLYMKKIEHIIIIQFKKLITK